MIEAAASQAGIALQVANEVSFLSTALWMTMSGLGVSVMPSAFATYSRHKELVVKTLMPRVSRDVYVVTKRGRSLSPACQEFIEVLYAGVAPQAGKRKSARGTEG
jgi:DNA-binding transcriptional LysR family regulator